MNDFQYFRPSFSHYSPERIGMLQMITIRALVQLCARRELQGRHRWQVVEI